MADSIIELSIYRAIQGLGGGSLFPIAFTIIYDIFPPEKRRKVTGLLGAVFGVSSILGPLLGAYITQYISWEWVFLINVPFGIISVLFIILYYKESVIYSKSKVDYLGAITLVISILCFMFGLELGGKTYAWDSGQILALMTGFLVFLFVFLYIERHVEEPIISFKMFQDRLFATSTLAGFFYGITFIIVTLYIPLFVQGVYGDSATLSGLILTPMILGSVVSSQIGGILITKMSYRNSMIMSAFLLVTGVYLLSTITPDTSRLVLTINMVVTGLGVGFSFSTLNMAALHNFDIQERGAATSTHSFSRSLGMTVGITIYGIIQRNLFSENISTTFKRETIAGTDTKLPDLNALLSPVARQNMPDSILDKVSSALSSSIGQTFMWTLIPACLAFIFILLMGNKRALLNSPHESYKKNSPSAPASNLKS